MTMRPGQERSRKSLDKTPGWRLWEALTTLWAWALLLAAFIVPPLPLHLLLVATTIAFLNAFVSALLHGYEAPQPSGTLRLAQVHDTTEIGGGRITELFAPLGLRFHATHHLVPSAPYYRLEEVRRRLDRANVPMPPIRGGLLRALRAWRHWDEAADIT